jgi:small subunit ribosomal protein S20
MRDYGEAVIGLHMWPETGNNHSLEVSSVPNIKSAKKRVVVNHTKAARNRSRNSALKTAIKKASAAAASGSADTQALVTAAIKTLDQAAAKGLLHKNNAARKKSALARLL